MKAIYLSLLTVLMTGVPMAAHGGGRCQSIPVQLTVAPVDNFGVSGPVTAAIQPDNGGPYVDGFSGVSATIDVCSGTYDLLLNLGNSHRSIGIDFRNMVGSPTPYTPTWTSAGPVPVTFMNIRNLFYQYSQSASYSFTTRLASNLGGVAGSYNFGMVNPTDQAYTAPPINPVMNNPVTTSDVIVWHYAAGSNGYAVETWVAYPDTTEMDPNTPNSFYVGGLATTSGHTAVSAGQFSVPFEIIVQRK
jgi:hypothetical protein